ncbi:MAG: hypothetical protein NTX71_08670 [Candidatus Aureabacteria bacterium]|nr:hypothetical protein [Candidatus Auribacterota bacterium]
MPEYDWLSTKEFVQLMWERVKENARNEGLDMESDVPFLLTVYLERYRKKSKQSELVKRTSERRTQSDAFASVDLLVKEAARYARARGSKAIEIEDMQQAHSSKFCMVWPLCG